MNKTEIKDRLRTLDRITKVEPGEQTKILPDEVWFGPFLYGVHMEESLRDRSRLGITWPDDQVIEINPSQETGRMRDTMLHEILHGLFSQIGQKDQGGKLKMTEEELIRRLSPALLDFLRTNRQMVLYLLAHTDEV